MDKRRLGGVLLCAAFALLMVSGGCAQGSGGAGARGKEGEATTEDAEALLARSAAGLERVMSGEQRPGEVAPPPRPPTDVTVVPSPAPAGRAVRDEPVAPAAAPTAPVQHVTVSTGNTERPVAPAGDAPGAAGGAVLSGWWGGGGEGEMPQAGTPGAGASAPAVVQAQSVSGFWKAEDAQGGGGFRISALALCTRVEGFGKFSRVESVRATGRAVPLLIYTQVDGFSYRTRDGAAASSGGEDGKSEWVVELGQSVAVYRVGTGVTAGSDAGKGDVLVKVEAEQTARDVAVFKRRDHFLVQRIELPTPLVAGKYVVKVSVRDKATGMVDERTAEVMVR